MTKRDLIDEVVKLYPALLAARRRGHGQRGLRQPRPRRCVRGERIEIRGFGSFVVKQRQAREGRNPQTGALRRRAPPSACPFFKVGKELRAARRRQAVDARRRSGRRLTAAAWRSSGPRGAWRTSGRDEDDPAASSAGRVEGDPRERLLLGASAASLVMLNRYPVRERAPDGGAAASHGLLPTCPATSTPTWRRRSGAPLRHARARCCAPRGSTSG